jgi:myo-inositol-1(or 4)-monophosphatase
MTPESLSLARELTVARQAAADAAALLVARAGADRVREKGRADLVTAVDEAAEEAVLARIRAAFPDDAVVAEETASAAVTGGRRWIVDPIDGTINFVHNHPFVCVSIGFADDEGPAVGVIHAPLLGEVYHAVRGGGAYLNDRPIHVSGVTDPAAALWATGFPFRKGKGDPEAYFRLVTELLLSSHGVRRAGSAALDLAYVAAGRVDGFFEIGLQPWDIAAGILLVREAGGRIGVWPGDREDPLITGRLLATNGALHEPLEAVVAKHAEAVGREVRSEKWEVGMTNDE